MMQLLDYIDLAKQRQSIVADEKLSAALFKPGNYIAQLRRRGLNPQPETMERLADLAGIDPRIALLDLARWQVKDSPVARLYAEMQTIIERAAKTAAVLAVVYVALVASASPSHAGIIGEQRALNSADIYIIR